MGGEQSCDHLIDGPFLVRAGTTVSVLELARVDTAIGDHEAMRDPQQLSVGKFDAGARVTIIDQHVDARRTFSDFAALSGTSTTVNGAIGSGQMMPAAS